MINWCFLLFVFNVLGFLWLVCSFLCVWMIALFVFVHCVVSRAFCALMNQRESHFLWSWWLSEKRIFDVYFKRRKARKLKFESYVFDAGVREARRCHIDVISVSLQFSLLLSTSNVVLRFLFCFRFYFYVPRWFRVSQGNDELQWQNICLQQPEWSRAGIKERNPWFIPQTVLALEGFLLLLYRTSPRFHDCWLSAHLPRLA